ncbi:MAG: S-methyl-5-thioribose-1-phosphate isomerase [Chloroflexi bacterium]|nr:MAG: S-methyl-5-thioribose-1-phosphate isomerase [Chloroflexota bacterium]
MRTLELRGDVVRMIDQRRLPGELVYVEIRDYPTVARSIQEMWVRGAPAIGAAGGFGLALAAMHSQAKTRATLLQELEDAGQALFATRPTAVNLGWAIQRVLNKARASDLDVNGLRDLVVAEAQAIAEEDIATNEKMARHGATLIDDGDTILHHCNTGPLATVDIGTALGCIIQAHRDGKKIHVLVDETRPRLQGARLTAWELMQYGVPMTLIADNAAGHYLYRGIATKVFYGADRVAANGDVANKIGSYKLAVVAHENNVPVYSVMPTTTIDMTLASGRDIPIEERGADEVTTIDGVRFAPEGVRVGNPAFDVTPNKYLTAIVTERGVVYPPFQENLARVMNGIK